VVNEIVWCGEASDEVLLALTDTSEVYRSTNKGGSWAEMTDLVDSVATAKSKRKADYGKISAIVLSPADKRIVFFIGSGGVNFVSENCGGTVRPLNNGSKIHEFEFHPSEPKWALASAWSTCDDFDEEEVCKIYKEVYYSQDLG
jgi:hypothetical protein